MTNGKPEVQGGGEACLLGFPEYREQGERLAAAAGLPFEPVSIHEFPDGESLLRLPPELPAHVVLCRSLDHANARLVELLLAAQGARELGARRLTLVAPYLCYMRQDKAFHPGETVSQKIIGRFLADHFDDVVTVDSHLHRVHRLQDAVPAAHAVNLTATALMGEFLAKEVEAPFLLGPDGESRQWVAAIAGDRGFDFEVAHKLRSGDRDVRVTLPEADFAGRNVVLVDDVASTGCTLEEAAKGVAEHRPASISVLVTHALFVGDAMQRLRAAGVGPIWSTDAVPHPTNAIHLAGLLAGELAELRGLEVRPPHRHS